MARTGNGSTANYLEVGVAVVAAYPFTLFAHFRLASLAASQVLVAITGHNSGDRRHLLFFETNVSKINAQSDTGITTAFAQTTSGPSVDTYHTGVGVWAGDADRRVYLDGGSKGTSSNSGTVGTVTRTTIGRQSRPTASAAINGRIAEVAIWNVALTDAEAEKLAAGFAPFRIRESSLVGYWPVYGDDSPEPDLSGHGRDMVLNGSMPKSDHPIMRRPGVIIGAGHRWPPVIVGGLAAERWLRKRKIKLRNPGCK